MLQPESDPVRLAPALLEHPTAGCNLRGSTLAGELDEGPNLLVFLRHFG